MNRLLAITLLLSCLSLVAEAGDPAKKVAGKSPDWLEKHLDEGDSPTRVAIVEEMGSRRDPALLPALLHAAGDADRLVRVAAVGSLGAYGPTLSDPSRDAAYLTALQDGDARVVAAAEAALQQRVQAAAEPGMGALTSQMSRLARSASGWQTRKAAVELLERLPPDPTVNTTLIEVARLESHPEVRRAAVVAIGSRGLTEGRPLLSRLRNVDPAEPVRLAAEDSLRRIGGPATSVVVAVLPFETHARSLLDFAEGLQDSFTSSLSAAEVATVVERRQVGVAMNELRFQDQHIDDGRAVQVGKLLRAGAVVTGSVRVQGDEVTCLAKRIDVVTGEVRAAQPAVGASHDLAALQRDCIKRLLGTF